MSKLIQVLGIFSLHIFLLIGLSFQNREFNGNLNLYTKGVLLKGWKQRVDIGGNQQVLHQICLQTRFFSWQANKLYSKWCPKSEKKITMSASIPKSGMVMFLQLSVGHTAHQHCCREPTGFFPQFILLKMVSLGQNVGVFYWHNVSRCYFLNRRDIFSSFDILYTWVSSLYCMIYTAYTV